MNGRVYLSTNYRRVVELRVNGLLIISANTTSPIVRDGWVIDSEEKEDCYGRYRPAEKMAGFSDDKE